MLRCHLSTMLLLLVRFYKRHHLANWIVEKKAQLNLVSRNPYPRTEYLSRVVCCNSLCCLQTRVLQTDSKINISNVIRHDSSITRKASGELDPPLFSLPSGCKMYYGHSRYGPKLVIYRTFDVFAAISLRPPHTRLPMIT